jgi:hypothetical protein
MSTLFGAPPPKCPINCRVSPPRPPSLGPRGPYNLSESAPYRPYSHYRPPLEDFSPSALLRCIFGKFLLAGGGGQRFLTRKIIYRKIFLRQNHMLTTAEVKRGRWVYEGGELEHNSKSLTGCYSVFRHYSNGL